MKNPRSYRRGIWLAIAVVSATLGWALYPFSHRIGGPSPAETAADRLTMRPIQSGESSSSEPLLAEPDCPIQFHDVTRETGITFVHNNGGSGKRYLVEAMSAGLALFDYDGDGLVDIYFLNGCRSWAPRLTGRSARPCTRTLAASVSATLRTRRVWGTRRGTAWAWRSPTTTTTATPRSS